nr:AzlC family ABC transporter permease [Herminiimonas sp. CN]
MENTGANGAHALPPEQAAFREGFRTSLASMPGILAWGLVSGMAMIKAGLTLWQALGMTFLVFAGSAQLAALPLMMANAPVIVIFATAMVVNLRFVIFGAALGPHFSHLPWYQRLWYGYFNGDIAAGLFPLRFPAETLYRPAGKAGFYMGIGYSNWLAWQVGAVAGIFLAGRIPESWNIGFAGTLALLAIMIPLIINAAALGGVVISGIVAVIAANLPYRLGLLLAMVLGMAAAMLIDAWLEKKKT